MMKGIIVYVSLVLLLLGCQKTSGPKNSAAFNIINAINNSNPIVTNFTPVNGHGIPLIPLQYYVDANQIPFTSSWESGSYVGAVALSISQISDTLLNIWSGEITLPKGSIHTLYFCGDTTSIDTLFATDIIPYYPFSDSVAGVRFVNLAQNSPPISVNIQGNPPNQMEFGNLGYKQISSFKTYLANSSASGNYNFEVRDMASDSLLTTISWSYALQKNNTLVIAGSLSAGYTVFQVNNY